MRTFASILATVAVVGAATAGAYQLAPESFDWVPGLAACPRFTARCQANKTDMLQGMFCLMTSPAIATMQLEHERTGGGVPPSRVCLIALHAMDQGPSIGWTEATHVYADGVTALAEQLDK